MSFEEEFKKWIEYRTTVLNINSADVESDYEELEELKDYEEHLNQFIDFVKSKFDEEFGLKVQELKEKLCLISGFDKETNIVTLCDSIYLFLDKKRSSAFEEYKKNNKNLKFKKGKCINCKKIVEVFGVFGKVEE